MYILVNKSIWAGKMLFTSYQLKGSATKSHHFSPLVPKEHGKSDNQKREKTSIKQERQEVKRREEEKYAFTTGNFENPPVKWTASCTTHGFTFQMACLWFTV